MSINIMQFLMGRRVFSVTKYNIIRDFTFKRCWFVHIVPNSSCSGINKVFTIISPPLLYLFSAKVRENSIARPNLININGPIRILNKVSFLNSFFINFILFILLNTGVNNRHYSKSLVSQLRSEEHTSELQSRFDLVCR